jgi:hypothetical protein
LSGGGDKSKTATKTGARAAEPEKATPHAKGAARSLPQHALHTRPRNAGAT